MRTRSTLMLATVTTALLLMAAAQTASANLLSYSEQGWRVIYRPLVFAPTFGERVRCNVTLEGSYHARTFAKVSGGLVGYITRAGMSECTGGRGRIDTETLPGHVTYESFTGSLPAIGSITLISIRLSFELESTTFGITGTCRYTPSTSRMIQVREPRGVITSTGPGSETIPSETSFCPSMTLEGRGSQTTPTGGTLVVTLI